MTRQSWWLTVCSALLVLWTAFALSPAVAQQTSAVEKELQAAGEAALAAMRLGPTEVPLRDQAVLRLPAGYGYISPDHARRLLRAMGNTAGSELDGLVVDAANPFDRWFAVIEYVASGYVKDDDARDWKADELLASLRQGTEASNSERRSRGFPEIEVVGWVERPAYDARTHRLIWSAETRKKGVTAGDAGVNYNTYALGREGYFSLNLVTGLTEIDGLKPRAGQLLGALAYRDGKRYEDFNPSTDRIAEYGLAALVAGAAAKKLGFFALIGVLLAKFWKIGALVVVVLGAGVMKLFRRGS